MKIFWPILKFFETEQAPQHYKKSHRMALIGVGILFWILSAGAAWAASYVEQLGVYIPVVVFFAIGFVSLVVGLFGSNGAVAKIWGGDK